MASACSWRPWEVWGSAALPGGPVPVCPHRAWPVRPHQRGRQPSSPFQSPAEGPTRDLPSPGTASFTPAGVWLLGSGPGQGSVCFSFLVHVLPWTSSVLSQSCLCQCFGKAEGAPLPCHLEPAGLGARDSLAAHPKGASCGQIGAQSMAATNKTAQETASCPAWGLAGDRQGLVTAPEGTERTLLPQREHRDGRKQDPDGGLRGLFRGDPS